MPSSADYSRRAGGAAGPARTPIVRRAKPPRGRLHVLHVGPTPFFSDRGCHIRIRGLMRALSERGVSGTLCTYHHGRDVDGVATARIPRVPGYTRVQAGPSGFKYLADALLGLLVLWRAWRERPDLLHGHLHEGALIAWAVSRLLFWRRLPVVFDVQGSLVGELEEHGYFGGRLARALFERVERFIDHRPDALACSSEQSLRIAAERFGVPRERLYLVADGADAAPAARTAPAAAVGIAGTAGATATAGVDGSPTTARDGGPQPRSPAPALPADRPVVAYTGALLPAKGLETLHEILVGAHRRGLRAHFLLVGYPEAETRRFVRRHGLEAICTLTGRLPYDRTLELLGRADIALEPKRADAGEGSGKLLNYMAAGLAVVAFDTPNNRTMLGDCGCYAEDASAAAMLEAIAALLEDPDRRRALGERARARARERFSWQRSAERLETIYARLLDRQQPAPSPTTGSRERAERDTP